MYHLRISGSYVFTRSTSTSASASTRLRYCLCYSLLPGTVAAATPPDLTVTVQRKMPACLPECHHRDDEEDDEEPTVPPHLYFFHQNHRLVPLSFQGDQEEKMLQPLSHRSIAIVGGGITGSCAAAELAKHFENVVVFDQGRRGPGGRASHRSVKAIDGSPLPDDNVLPKDDIHTFEFDHGCQFFRADSDKFRQLLLKHWYQEGWVTPWKARLGKLHSNSNNSERAIDFFGVPSHPGEVYIGYGGMHRLPRNILQKSKAHIREATRVSRVLKNNQGKWDLYGTTGKAAFHDTSEKESNAVTEEIIGSADAVVFTDISSAFGSWHRASAGIPDELRRQIPTKVRLPLFSCMVALSDPIEDQILLDGFSTDHDTLWFAARSQSKPGFPTCKAECWTLVSTPSFAVDQIRETNMRDPATGAFRPQENSYLNSVPGPALFNAFLQVIQPYLSNTKPPNAIYLQAQRWGSGLPVPHSMVVDVHDICGTEYAKHLKSDLVYTKPTECEMSPDFMADDSLRLYYAGDFCSHRSPGFEAAALSGLDVAKHIIATFH